MIRSNKIQLVPSRLIIDKTEYYWQNIIQVELQYGTPEKGLSFSVLLPCVVLCWALAISLGNYWLFLVVSLTTFSSLALLKRKQQYDIVLHYRDKDGVVKTIRPLLAHGISMTEEEKQQLFIDMRKTHVERG